MNHSDPSLISSFIDGDMDLRDARELEEHLGECEACSALVEELQRIQRRARELPEHLPTRDLWPGIARAIEDRGADDPDVIRLHPRTARGLEEKGGGRRIPVSWAAAAGLVVALVSGMAGSRFGQAIVPGGETAQVVPSDVGPSHWVTQVGEAEPALGAVALDVARMEEVLARRRGSLDSLTARVLEKNLDTIDRAIQESLAALAADPGNRFLEENLERAVLKKGEYLKSATVLVEPIV